MIVSDAVEYMKTMGAKRVGKKLLEDIHGVYAVEMFSPDFQHFYCIGLLPDRRTASVQRALFTVSDIASYPILAVLFDRKPPGVKLFIADEILTKHRLDTENLFGVISIRFPLNLGKTIESLEGLKKLWRELRLDWEKRKKKYRSRKVQKKMNQYP